MRMSTGDYDDAVFACCGYEEGKDDQEDKGYCASCEGSGEGRSDGATCPNCKGSGVAK